MAAISKEVDMEAKAVDMVDKAVATVAKVVTTKVDTVRPDVVIHVIRLLITTVG